MLGNCDWILPLIISTPLQCFGYNMKHEKYITKHSKLSSDVLHHIVRFFCEITIRLCMKNSFSFLLFRFLVKEIYISSINPKLVKTCFNLKNIRYSLHNGLSLMVLSVKSRCYVIESVL